MRSNVKTERGEHTGSYAFITGCFHDWDTIHNKTVPIRPACTCSDKQTRERQISGVESSLELKQLETLESCSSITFALSLPVLLLLLPMPSRSRVDEWPPSATRRSTNEVKELTEESQERYTRRTLMELFLSSSLKKQGLDLRYLRQSYLEEDFILDLGYWMLFLLIKTC